MADFLVDANVLICVLREDQELASRLSISQSIRLFMSS
jgi:hypothetical protein